MQIQIINVQSTTKPTKTGSYSMLDVTFKNLTFGGKTDGKKIMSFANKEVYDALVKAQNGENYNVTVKKNEQTGYNDWTSVSKEGAPSGDVPTPATSATKTFASPKSTYETPEERAARQVMIVRQSSLSNAIAILKTEKNTPTKEDVFALAQEMVNWVLQLEADVLPDFTDMSDDIPM